ncbi:putative nucleic acid-binding, replication factor A [Helianthus anomalus]
MSDKNWLYNACPKCRQTMIQTGSEWFCFYKEIRRYYHKTKCRYRIPVRISENTGTINGTVFDQAAYQLLQQTCAETLTKQNQTQLLQLMKNREAQFQVQAEQDLKNRSIRCTVNSANYVQTQTTNYTSTSTPPITTPKPVTPPPTRQNTTSAKRSLNMLEGTQNSSYLPINHFHSYHFHISFLDTNTYNAMPVDMVNYSHCSIELTLSLHSNTL